MDSLAPLLHLFSKLWSDGADCKEECFCNFSQGNDLILNVNTFHSIVIAFVCQISTAGYSVPEAVLFKVSPL